MLKLVLPATDTEQFVELKLEHSLVSLYNWEAEYKKPFFSKEPHPAEEMLTYIQYMLLNKTPDGWINRFTKEDFTKITSYINDTQTATTFHETTQPRGSGEIVTAELIYHWMLSFQIPFDPCETWHLNRLMTLVRVCGIKQTKPKPMKKNEQAELYQRLNAERKARLGTNG